MTQPRTMIRLLLVEDHVMVRQSIRAYLESESVCVVGETASGEAAVRLAHDLHPDVILMDIHLPDISGIEATRRIRRHLPDMRVIALTAYNEPAYVEALEAAGAQAFVLKTAALSDLLAVIRRTVEVAQPLPHPPEPPAQPISLTERELETLRCAARGWTNKQIGAALTISDRTVQVHLHSIFHKLRASSRTEAVARAIALGIIPLIDGDES